MACKHAFPQLFNATPKNNQTSSPEKAKQLPAKKPTYGLLFGVDSECPANETLQNNLQLFEWVMRNKTFPSYWGRNLNGNTPLTTQEIAFLHGKGCKILASVIPDGETEKDAQGLSLAKRTAETAQALGVPAGCAVFLSLKDDAHITRDYLRGYAKGLLRAGYTPGFQMNTDARFTFDREFSRGMQTDRDLFGRCLVWATAPSVSEYDDITTSHLVHPDNWIPYAPSGITRREIALWRYGNRCHRIESDDGIPVTFNMDLVQNGEIVTDKMF